VELRPVDLRGVRHLQVVTHDERTATTANHAYGDAAGDAVDSLLAEPFGNWHVQTTTETVQLRVTKKGQAQVHRAAAAAQQATDHDRAAAHLVDPGDPLFRLLGAGADKRRQVDAFLRVLQAALADAELPADRPLHVVDLGCGHAYLTFAAYRYLSADRDVRLTGVDVRDASRERNAKLAADLGWSDAVSFVASEIRGAPVDGPVDVVLALHACDTATDDALAEAVRWSAPVVLAAPCCHHDLQRQLRAAATPTPYAVLTRHGILHERFGDVLTDALRAALLRREGYRTDVVQFVASEHTPRDTMIRAVRSDVRVADPEYAELVATWGVTPYLQTLLDAGR
jgi:SAM-dependent methyltransferase